MAGDSRRNLTSTQATIEMFGHSNGPFDGTPYVNEGGKFN